MLAAAHENTALVRGCREFAGKRRVTPADVQLVVTLACQARLPAGRAITRVRVLCFLVDGVMAFNPVGMECERLGVSVELVTV